MIEIKEPNVTVNNFIYYLDFFPLFIFWFLEIELCSAWTEKVNTEISGLFSHII